MGMLGPKLVVCSTCRVHIKRSEAVCPHCGALHRSWSSAAAPFVMGVALSGCPAGADDDDPMADDFGENSAYGTPDTGFSDVGESNDTTGSSNDAGDSTGPGSTSATTDDGTTGVADDTTGATDSGGSEGGSTDTTGGGSDSGGSDSGGSGSSSTGG